MTEPLIPAPKSRPIAIDAYRIIPSKDGHGLWFIMPGWTHIICGVN